MYASLNASRSVPCAVVPVDLAAVDRERDRVAFLEGVSSLRILIGGGAAGRVAASVEVSGRRWHQPTTP